MQKLVLILIKGYQKYFAWLNGPGVCRFYPRCSQYTYEAITKYGVVKGIQLGLIRVSRCHPWHDFGVDLVN